MKVYMLTQDDIDLLTTLVDRNPEHGQRGGSSQHGIDIQAHREAHSFYNYQVRTWIAKVTK
jgi:hypothetical protein